MKKIFINKNKQLRSGWKISLVLTLSFMIITGLFYILRPLIEGNSLFLIMGIIQSIVFIKIILVMWKLLDKKPFSDMGLTPIRGNYKQLVIGLVCGMLSMSIVFLVLLMIGDIKLENSILAPNFHPTILIYLLLFTLVGFNEELFSRGYCMTVLKQTGNKWVVLLGSSLIFSVLHINNPNIELIGLLNIFLIGLLFAYMFIRTGSIWMPIGYHITWNFFQGNIFGFEVSGLDVLSVYNNKLIRSNFINGGLFGPEGGLLVTLIIIIGFVFVYFITINKGAKNEFFN
ncbi:MAG: CPBP family intramembrane metalloprotease domain-containing protein [Firmicutes bacterium HGW-Firmicutes-7]|nr:MAG: CPBP family intramembrane metalloprotease domain-containing protein [Firmicutes bacterium HGW-Firmicutes-7]